MTFKYPPPFPVALESINLYCQDQLPSFNLAFRALHEYQRFWELAELDRRLYPHTTIRFTTATRFLDRSPAALTRADFQKLVRALDDRFVLPFMGQFPLFEGWAERVLEGGEPLLEPYPIGPNFTIEDMDLAYTDPACLDPGFTFFWLFNADWAIDAEQRPVYWQHITAAYGFPDAPLPVKTLGLAAEEYRFDPEAFQTSIEEDGLGDLHTCLLAALGETGSPYVDYRPFEDGMLPWELDFTPENIQLLGKFYQEGQEIIVVYEQGLARLQAEPDLFPQLIDRIESAHKKRRRR